MDFTPSHIKSRIITYKCKYDQIADNEFEKNYSDEGLIYTDNTVIENQRSSINYLVKKIGSQLLKGESVMNISLPVFMFDERSLCETYYF